MSDPIYESLDGGSSRSQIQPPLPHTPKDLSDRLGRFNKDSDGLNSMNIINTTAVLPSPTSNLQERNLSIKSPLHPFKSKSFVDLSLTSRPNSHFDNSIKLDDTNDTEDIDMFQKTKMYQPSRMLDKLIDTNFYPPSSNKSIFSAKSSLEIPYNVESPLLLKQVEIFHNGPTRQTSRLDIFNRSNKLTLQGVQSEAVGTIEDKPKVKKRARLHRRLKSMFTTGSNHTPYPNEAQSTYGAVDRVRRSDSVKFELNPVKPAQYASQIAAYHFSNHQPNTCNPAIFLALIQVNLSDAMDLLDSDLHTTTLHAHKFRICLSYGERRWVIKRRLIDFLKLHTSLKLGYLVGRDSVKVPKFPNSILYNFNYIDREHTRNYRYYERRRSALQLYLEKLLKRFNLVFKPELLEFLELSTNSFTNDSFKGREGYMNLQLGNRFISECLPIKFTKYKMVWCKINDTCLVLTNQLNFKDPYEVILFTPSFNVTKSKTMTESCLLVEFGSDTQMKFKMNTLHTLDEWHQPISKAVEDCSYSKLGRIQSFAPMRNETQIVPLIDGDVYFKSVYFAILNARSTIYIMDWWLSPELYLLRPASKHPESRLDRLLKLKASQGVLIFILLYKEISLSLPNDSNHSKQQLKKLHPNIKVLRHPDHVTTTSVWFWAHHEKVVLIDNKIGFIGGLDLCFARYDTDKHRLVDSCPNQPVWPGIDYSNVRVKEYNNVSSWQNDFIDRTQIPRLPWHDINLKFYGKVVDDLQLHFVERWNFVKRSKARNKPELPFLVPYSQPNSTAPAESSPEEDLSQSYQAQMLRSSSNWSSGIPTECSIYNTYLKLIANAKHFIYIENQFFVTSSVNLPSNTVKNLIGEAIVERIVKAYKAKQRFRIIVVLPLLPSFEHDVHHPDAVTLRLVIHWQYQSISRGKYSILGRLHTLGIDWKEYITFNGLRTHDELLPNPNIESASPSRSTTLQQAEFSKAVPNPQAAQSTQSVATSSQVDPIISPASSVTNLSVASSVPSTIPSTKSVLQADDSVKFVTEQVYIHSKLMIVDDTFMIVGSANLNDRSQLGCRDSEVALLVAPNHWDGTFKDELPICKVVRDTRLDLFKEHCGFELGSNTSVSNYWLDFTKEPWYVLLDPTSEPFWNFWTHLSSNNTKIYRDLFHCVPDNLIYNWDSYEKFFPDPSFTPTGHIDYRNWTDKTNSEIQASLNQVQGHLVEFPVDFLKEETKLDEVPTFAPEAIVPVDVFI